MRARLDLRIYLSSVSLSDRFSSGPIFAFHDLIVSKVDYLHDRGEAFYGSDRNLTVSFLVSFLFRVDSYVSAFVHFEMLFRVLI